MILTPEQLLKDYESFIKIKATHYSKKGLEYADVYNQCYLYLFENCPLCDNKDDLKYCVENKLRTYYRHEIKERHFNYGTNPEDYNI
jgi:hypothetical protein